MFSEGDTVKPYCYYVTLYTMNHKKGCNTFVIVTVENFDAMSCNNFHMSGNRNECLLQIIAYLFHL